MRSSNNSTNKPHHRNSTSSTYRHQQQTNHSAGGVTGDHDTTHKKSLVALQLLNQEDPHITNLIAQTTFVCVYEWKRDRWSKLKVEGFLFLVERRTTPRFQIVIKNQKAPNDLYLGITAQWDLQTQKNYVFCKFPQEEDPPGRSAEHQDHQPLEDLPCKRLALWFHDDTERETIFNALTEIVDSCRLIPQDLPRQKSNTSNRQSATGTGASRPRPTIQILTKQTPINIVPRASSYNNNTPITAKDSASLLRLLNSLIRPKLLT